MQRNKLCKYPEYLQLVAPPLCRRGALAQPVDVAALSLNSRGLQLKYSRIISLILVLIHYEEVLRTGKAQEESSAGNARSLWRRLLPRSFP